MHPVCLPLAEKKPPATHQPYSKLAGAATFQLMPAMKFKAAQVVTLLLDHQDGSEVRLKRLLPRNKTLRPLRLRSLAVYCCHVFMAVAACGRWDPKWR